VYLGSGGGTVGGPLILFFKGDIIGGVSAKKDKVSIQHLETTEGHKELAKDQWLPKTKSKGRKGSPRFSSFGP